MMLVTGHIGRVLRVIALIGAISLTAAACAGNPTASPNNSSVNSLLTGTAPDWGAPSVMG
jgi:hypothetical protein